VTQNTCTFIPYSFSPFSTFIASTASGIGLPPRTKTPSISKAKAKESVVRTSAGAMGEIDDSGVLDVSGELDDSGELDISGVLDVSGEPDVGESISPSSRPIAANSLLAVSREAAKLSWCDWDL
jgi:hypothetical protein